ncbi:MAG: DNA-deoxyinosine glycosylase [Oscillospiraceae bacterium]|nr:DNA-deoxyinosine glycosylase [Oscillospiraceae bacterium]
MSEKADKKARVFHTIGPEFDSSSRILILGTMPSPKSREHGFYYAHPQNRFWKVMSAVTGCAELDTAAEKREFLRAFHIALWDVLQSCDIENASDTSIKNPVPNDIEKIFSRANILQVFTTGKKAYTLYNRLCPSAAEHPAVPLPSTSPANCRLSLDDLIAQYGIIKKFL